MMIKLSDNCYVAAEEISEIKANDRNLEIRLKNGREYRHDPEYGQGLYEALDALVAKVNAAREPT